MTKQEKVKYEVITQEDENGNVLLPLPPELLEQMGWKEGDTLDFKIDDKGRWIIQKI